MINMKLFFNYLTEQTLKCAMADSVNGFVYWGFFLPKKALNLASD